MEPEFVNESMWDDDDDGANNEETNFGEDDSNMEMTGFDGSTTGDGNMTGSGEGGAVGDAQAIQNEGTLYRGLYEDRRVLVVAIAGDLSRPTLVQAMIQSERAWQAVTSFCVAVMLAKEEAERMRQQESQRSTASR